MRRIILPIATAAAIAATAFAIPSAGAGDVAHHRHPKPDRDTRELAKRIARARLALAPYATDLGAAQAAGYKLTITQHMPGMGWHFMNPDVTEFDVARPPILVYIRKNGQDQLVAAEWVWPTKPAKRPLPGAKYGSFAAACHYVDGTFTPQRRSPSARRPALRAAPRSASGTRTW